MNAVMSNANAAGETKMQIAVREEVAKQIQNINSETLHIRPIKPIDEQGIQSQLDDLKRRLAELEKKTPPSHLQETGTIEKGQRTRTARNALNKEIIH